MSSLPLSSTPCCTWGGRLDGLALHAHVNRFAQALHPYSPTNVEVTLGACAVLCSQHPQCTAFTYKHEDGANVRRCWLSHVEPGSSGSNGEGKAIQGFVSGRCVARQMRGADGRCRQMGFATMGITDADEVAAAALMRSVPSRTAGAANRTLTAAAVPAQQPVKPTTELGAQPSDPSLAARLAKIAALRNELAELTANHSAATAAAAAAAVVAAEEPAPARAPLPSTAAHAAPGDDHNLVACTPWEGQPGGDLDYEACFPFCVNNPRGFVTNCQRCRCKQCELCRMPRDAAKLKLGMMSPQAPWPPSVPPSPSPPLVYGAPLPRLEIPPELLGESGGGGPGRRRCSTRHGSCSDGHAGAAAAPAADDAALENVTQLLFFATHTLRDVDDRAMLRLYRHELPAEARLWVMLFFEDDDTVELEPDYTRDIGAGVFTWGERALHAYFPSLAAAATAHPGLAAEKSHKKALYYFFHSSLCLWNASFGHAYPALRFWWRIELDVLFSAPLSTMLRLAARDDADVLLPYYTQQADSPGYGHWWHNEAISNEVPEALRVYSLVSIGRYSSRFLASMARRWAQGVIGYEEILIPVTCNMLNFTANRSQHGWPCRLGHFTSTRSITPNHFRFRPDHPCEDFLAARQQGEGDVWHPVKERRCFVKWLEEQDTGEPISLVQ